MTPPDDLVTIKWAAERLKVHTMTVRRMIERGELGPVTRLGRKAVRLTRVGVEDCIKLNTEEFSR